MIVRVACRRHYRKGRKEHKGKRVKREFLVLLRLFFQNWDAPFSTNPTEFYNFIIL
jgi:hypothetical protein